MKSVRVWRTVLICLLLILTVSSGWAGDEKLPRGMSPEQALQSPDAHIRAVAAAILGGTPSLIEQSQLASIALFEESLATVQLLQGVAKGDTEPRVRDVAVRALDHIGEKVAEALAQQSLRARNLNHQFLLLDFAVQAELKAPALIETLRRIVSEKDGLRLGPATGPYIWALAALDGNSAESQMAMIPWLSVTGASDASGAAFEALYSIPIREPHVRNSLLDTALLWRDTGVDRPFWGYGYAARLVVKNLIREGSSLENMRRVLEVSEATPAAVDSIRWAWERMTTGKIRCRDLFLPGRSGFPHFSAVNSNRGHHRTIPFLDLP